MKYKLLLSLLVVSVLAVGVAEAKEYSGDLDALEAALKWQTSKKIVKIIGGPPTRVSGDQRDYWVYDWKFFDTVTEQTYKKFTIRFSDVRGPKEAIEFTWEK